MEIFKYISDNNFKVLIENIFVKNLIKFSKVKDFNDPFELKPNFTGIVNDELTEDFKNPEFLKKILIKQFNDNPEINTKMTFEEFFELINSNRIVIDAIFNDIINNNQLLGSFKEQYNEGIERFGILSLATQKDNLLMWSHYANSHKGFVIEFDPKNDFFNTKIDSKSFCGKLHKVKYLEKRPSGKLADFEDISLVWLTKSKEWEYENEYRMFMPLEKAKSSINDLFLFEFPSKMIKSVYLGCNMSIENKNLLVNLLKSIEHLKHIKIFQSQISEEDYILIFNEI